MEGNFMDQAQKDYKKLHALSRETRVLQSVAHLLDWDQETYMPADGAEIRSEQLKVLAGLIHKAHTGKKFSNALAKLIDIESGKILVKGLEERQKAALKEWRRDYRHAIALPTKFVEEFTQLSSQSITIWRLAKNEDTFQRFAPYLEKIITMCRRKADFLGYQDHPYDALLDEYEPGSTTKEVQTLFSSLAKSLTSLIGKIGKAPQVNDSFLYGDFDQNKQIEFSHMILEAMGYR